MRFVSAKAATLLFSFGLLACSVAIPLTMIGHASRAADKTPESATSSERVDDDAFADAPLEAAGLDSYDWHSADDIPEWYYTLDTAPHDASPYAEDEATNDSPQQRGRGNTRGRGARGGGGIRGVYRASVSPTWFANSKKFWYRNALRNDTSEFILVDAEHGTRGPAFDKAKLAAALRGASDREVDADRLDFTVVEGEPLLKFNDDATEVSFVFAGGMYTCKLTGNYECTRTGDAPAVAEPDANAEGAADGQTDPQQGRRGGRGARGGQGGRGGGRGGRGGGAVRSPDGEWTAEVREGNIFLRKTGDESGDAIQLSQDGTAEIGYRNVQFSPDGKSLVAFRVEPGENLEVHLIQSSPPEGGRAVYSHRPYALPGDKFASYELNLFQLDSRKQTKPEVEKVDFGQPIVRWSEDGHNFSYQKVDRGHQRFRLINVDAATGETFNLIDEKTETFIWTAHTESAGPGLANGPAAWVRGGDEIIWATEKDGWRHLYLVDGRKGGVKNQITKGDWVVRGIDRIDADKRQIWFQASGRNPDQDPYLVHFYRINFDGTDLVALTAGNGNHAISYSPDEKYLVDTYNRVDFPGVTELRRVADGQLVCQLEETDISEMKEQGRYQPIEVFTAKGRDDKTDIWGVITRPRDFDPSKKYPVIENIYAGPQGAFVPKTFRANSYADLANQGYIVVQIDGMGTANRSKAFHDECWHDLKDGGFLDRIKWMQAAAEKYPYMDLSRVGIYGTSAGGQNAMAALLFHPEFYKAAVANCGCHDNRMDKASWNEQWMGYPIGPQYSESSNVDNAWRLRGKLMLVLGELDTNVPPESTMRVCSALIQANRDFEFYSVPNADHGAGAAPPGYNNRRLQDFFAKSLQGVDPPNRNETPAERPGGRGGRRGRGVLGGGPVRDESVAGAMASPYAEQQAAEAVQDAAQPAQAAANAPVADTPATAQGEPAAQPPLVLTGLESRATRTSRIVSRYRADRNSLGGFYLAADAPSTRTRLRQFDTDWIAALAALPAETLSQREQEEIAGLKQEAADDIAKLDDAARADARIAPLVPFADTIYQLIEERLAVKPMNAEASALRIDAVTAHIKANTEVVKARLEKAGSNGGGAVPLVAGDFTKAAARVASLKQLVGRWHGFYDGYDPLFSWWMRVPYSEVNKALDAYAAFLKEAAGKVEGAAAEVNSPVATTPELVAVATLPITGKPAGEVPDLKKLLNEQRGYMELVVARYQQESGRGGGRGGRGGGRGGRGGRGGDGSPANEADAGPSGERGQGDRAQPAADENQNGEAQPDGERGRRGIAAADGQDEAQAGGGDASEGGGRRRRGGGGNRGGGFAAPESREQLQARTKRWLDALNQLDFNSFSRADKVDYYLLQHQLQQQMAGAAGGGGGGGRNGRGEREDRDGSGILVLPPVGREALMADLAREMVDYTPEELIEIGKSEMKVCRAEMLKATREMGLGDNWQEAVEKVKNMHVPPGEQPQMIRDVAWQAIDYLNANNLITVPPIAAEVWGMQMMSPQRQLVNPFFTGGASISVSYPTDTMSTEAKIQSMRGNNYPFARATAFHELIPGHNMQQFMASRYNTHRRALGSNTPFWTEGWSLYWELLLYDKGFTQKPEDRVGALVWRSHRCARIVFSLSYHMGKMTPKECVDYLVTNVGFDRLNAEGEVRRSFEGGYGPLYQAAYLLGGIQLRSLHKEVVESGKLTDRDFHDMVVEAGNMPINMVRVLTTDVPCTREKPPEWKFYGDVSVPAGVGGAAP